MPMLEVLISRDRSLSEEAKEAFREEAEAIFQEVLGTPKGRLRLFLWEEKGERRSDKKSFRSLPSSKSTRLAKRLSEKPRP
jgi:hypothetical protein